MPDHRPPPPRAERRRNPRWRDKRLLTLLDAGGEHPGMTADLSATGMQLALSRCHSPVGALLHFSVAFAQDVLDGQGTLVHTRRRPWGVLAGVRFTPGQEELRRFLSRRYPTPTQAPAPLHWVIPGSPPAELEALIRGLHLRPDRSAG